MNRSHPDCAVCRKRLAYQRQLKARWRAAGACVICGKPCAPFGKCMRHRVLAMQSHHRQRARKKAEAA